MKHEIQNSLFGGDAANQLKKLIIKDSRIRLSATVRTPSREIVPIAEALVAYDTQTGTIIKFISAFIPPPVDGAHCGIKYLISTDRETGLHKPVVIAWQGKKDSGYWNPSFLTAYLDYSKLPMAYEHAEFRVLRAYRAGLRAPARFELLAFDTPPAGQDVDKHTMTVECPFNSTPPIQLARTYKHLFWWQKQILNEIGLFAGVDLMAALGLGIKRKLDQAVAKGDMTPAMKEEILHDHSEDPVEMEEPLRASFGLPGKRKGAAEEGFYVPDNPLAKTAGAEEAEEEEEMEEPLSASFGLPATHMVAAEAGDGKDFYVPDNPLAKTAGAEEAEEEELVEFFNE
jgi:hypothetical protein